MKITTVVVNEMKNNNLLEFAENNLIWFDFFLKSADTKRIHLEPTTQPCVDAQHIFKRRWRDRASPKHRWRDRSLHGGGGREAEGEWSAHPSLPPRPLRQHPLQEMTSSACL